MHVSQTQRNYNKHKEIYVAVLTTVYLAFASNILKVMPVYNEGVVAYFKYRGTNNLSFYIYARTIQTATLSKSGITGISKLAKQSGISKSAITGIIFATKTGPLNKQFTTTASTLASSSA